MDKADIPFLSATELSQLIAAKEVSPVEATEAYLERIDDLDFKFSAYLTVYRKEALESARKAEEAIAQGNYLGPIAGRPGEEEMVLKVAHAYEQNTTWHTMRPPTVASRGVAKRQQ